MIYESAKNGRIQGDQPTEVNSQLMDQFGLICFLGPSVKAQLCSNSLTQPEVKSKSLKESTQILDIRLPRVTRLFIYCMPPLSRLVPSSNSCDLLQLIKVASLRRGVVGTNQKTNRSLFSWNSVLVYWIFSRAPLPSFSDGVRSTIW